MSRFILGNCVHIMTGFPDNAVDFILTDPPYLVGFRDRQGRTIAGDKTDEWLQPACNEMYRVLKKDALMVSFYGWNRVDRFMAVWKSAGFSVVGHLVFTKTYTSKSAYVGYRHECAYLLAKGRPTLPQNPLPDVLGWKYSGNRHHPTEKPVTSLQPLIESFTHPDAIVHDPFAGSRSTCVAALQAGRRYIGIELLEHYHQAGQKRLDAVRRAMQTPAENDDRWYPEAAFIASEYTGECDYDAFDDAYRGEAESEEDYAREMSEDNGLLNEVPEPLRSYFDFEAWARDLFSCGYVFHDGYVFSN